MITKGLESTIKRTFEHWEENGGFFVWLLRKLTHSHGAYGVDYRDRKVERKQKKADEAIAVAAQASELEAEMAPVEGEGKDAGGLQSKLPKARSMGRVGRKRRDRFGEEHAYGGSAAHMFKLGQQIISFRAKKASVYAHSNIAHHTAQAHTHTHMLYFTPIAQVGKVWYSLLDKAGQTVKSVIIDHAHIPAEHKRR
jgi:hypothetical protein